MTEEISINSKTVIQLRSFLYSTRKKIEFYFQKFLCTI